MAQTPLVRRADRDTTKALYEESFKHGLGTAAVHKPHGLEIHRTMGY